MPHQGEAIAHSWVSAHRAPPVASPMMRFEHILVRDATAALLVVVLWPAFAQDAPTLAREANNPLANQINFQFVYDACLHTGLAKHVARCNGVREALRHAPCER
jgi:hypothetical protein